jgi:hypothetical protein
MRWKDWAGKNESLRTMQIRAIKRAIASYLAMTWFYHAKSPLSTAGEERDGGRSKARVSRLQNLFFSHQN